MGNRGVATLCDFSNEDFAICLQGQTVQSVATAVDVDELLATAKSSVEATVRGVADNRRINDVAAATVTKPTNNSCYDNTVVRIDLNISRLRSEERRVGKECR